MAGRSHRKKSKYLLPPLILESPFLPEQQQKNMVRPPLDHTAIKFLCSYGGKILPRHSDGNLRYVGGHTRVLSVDRSISFAELLLKLEDLCGTTLSLRCQLPIEDLDALVSIKSDEDLAHIIEEYKRACSNHPSLKVRAFISVPISGVQQNTSPPSSDTCSPKSLSPRSSSSSSSFSSTSAVGSTSNSRFPVPMAPVMAYPVKSAKQVAQYAYNHNRNPSTVYLLPSETRWH